MLVEEEEVKQTEVNPDIIDEALFVDEGTEEVDVLIFAGEDEQADALDLAFVDDEDHW
jgi:hypothetical protein